MKKYIAGFLTCAILIFTLLSFGFAEGISVFINPYPILIDGQQAKIESYNINGRTYLALGDIAKYFDYTAVLNESTKQIEIDTAKSATNTLTISVVPNLMVENGVIVDVATREPVSAEFLYMDTNLKELPPSEYVEHKHCKVVKYNDNIYMHDTDIFTKLDIHYKSLGYIESNSFKFYKGDREVISNRQTLGVRISVDGDIYFNIRLLEELIGE